MSKTAKIVSWAVALVAVAAAAFGARVFWNARPWRPVVSVNGQILTLGEMRARGAGLLADAEKNQHLIVPKKRRGEAIEYYGRQAARLWVFKRLMLDEAVREGVSVSDADAADSVKKMEKRLKGRDMTVERFFKDGPLPEAMLREEFREGVLVNKFLDKAVGEKIKLSPDEIEERTKALQDAAMKGASGRPPKRVSRKDAIDSLRAERYRKGVDELYRSLRGKADIREYLPVFEEKGEKR